MMSFWFKLLKKWTLERSLVPFTKCNRPRILRFSQSAVFCLVPKSADFEVLVYFLFQNVIVMKKDLKELNAMMMAIANADVTSLAINVTPVLTIFTDFLCVMVIKKIIFFNTSS